METSEYKLYGAERGRIELPNGIFKEGLKVYNAVGSYSGTYSQIMSLRVLRALKFEAVKAGFRPIKFPEIQNRVFVADVSISQLRQLFNDNDVRGIQCLYGDNPYRVARAIHSRGCLLVDEVLVINSGRKAYGIEVTNKDKVVRYDEPSETVLKIGSFYGRDGFFQFENGQTPEQYLDFITYSPNSWHF